MEIKINGYDVIHVNKETGEVIAETEGCTSIESSVKMPSELKKEEYVNTHCIDFNKDEPFVKMYPKVVNKLASVLKPNEFKTVMMLSRYVDYENCVLVFGNRKYKHYMTLQEISDVTKIQYSKIATIMRSLIKKGIIGIFKTGNKTTEKLEKCYVVNPYIYMNGKNPLKDICILFKNSGWEDFINS